MKKIFFLSVIFLFGILGGGTYADAETSQQITNLYIENDLSIPRAQAPVSWAVPLPKNQNITDAKKLHLLRDGTEISAQFTPTARWGSAPDDTSKPIMWVLIDAQVDLSASERATFTLSSGERSAFASPLTLVQNDAAAVVIDTGAAEYHISKTTFRFFDTVTLADGTTFRGDGGIMYKGNLILRPAIIEVEHRGPERITLKVGGSIADGLEYTARMHFYKNLAEIKVDFRLENLNATRTEGGQPQAAEYGSSGSVNFDDLSIRVPAAPNKTYTLPQGELGASGEVNGTFASDVAVIQESSGDEHWDVMKGLAPRLQSGVQKRASTRSIDGAATDGPNQIAGWLDSSGVTVAVERAWQNFPKAFRAQSGFVEIGLFPGEYSRNFELRSGEFKTHTFFVRHHAENMNDVAKRVKSMLSPLYWYTSAEYLAETAPGILLSPLMNQDFPDYEAGVEAQIAEDPDLRAYFLRGGNTDSDEQPTLLDSISTYGHYGIVDYGDIPTDFEARFGPYNWKYDGLRGAMIQMLRKPESDVWFELATAGCRHVADTDIHHSRLRGYAADRGWFEGGIYGHTFHNEEGRNSPHRQAGPPETAMGGPAAGVLLCSIISGDTLLLDSGLEVTDNMYYRAVNSNYDLDVNSNYVGGAAIAREVGLQQCVGNECQGYEPLNGSRIGGNAVQAMLMAYIATGDNTYLDLVSKFANYLQRLETQTGNVSCDRFHFQTTFVKNLGHYLFLRSQIGFGGDTPAVNLLSRRMDYMRRTLWDPEKQIVRTCYDSGDAFAPGFFENNWQLGAADSFAIGSLVLNDPTLLTDYARKSFEYGSKHIAWTGSPRGYFATKEFVNQVGFGNMFQYAWYTAEAGTPTDDVEGQPLDDACSLTQDRAYKSPTNPAVYYVDSTCHKRSFRNSNIYFTYFTSWGDIRIVSDAQLRRIPNHELGFMPLGPLYNPQYGALVKIVDDPKVYFLLNDQKYWITSEEVFEALQYDWKWIEDIDPRLLDNYPSGGEIRDISRHLDGTIIKYANSPRVYVLDDGEKRHVIDEEAFESLGYRWDRIVTVPQSETYPDGEPKTVVLL